MREKSYKTKQIESVVASINERFDRFNDVIIADCDKSMRKLVMQWSARPFKSPLGFGDVIVTEPYRKDTENACFGYSVELMKHAVKNVYGGSFKEGLNEFSIEDGSVKELLGRLYPTSYSWIYDKHGSLPVSGSYTAPIELTEDLAYAFSSDPLNRDTFMDEMRDEPVTFENMLRNQHHLPSIDGDTRFSYQEYAKKREQVFLSEEEAEYWRYLKETDDEMLSPEELRDKKYYFSDEIQVLPSALMEQEEYEEMKKELRAYMTPEELEIVDDLAEEKENQGEHPNTPYGYNY